MDDFRNCESDFLDGNPWVRNTFDFSGLKGKQVLEIGSGSGAASCLLGKAGAHVTAIDLTSEAVQMTRQNATFQGVSLQVTQMDAENLSFNNGSFDFVFSWGVLHHSANPQACFREVARVLKPNGRGLIMVYNRKSLRYLLKGIYWLICNGKWIAGETLPSVQRFFSDGFHQRHYSPHELQRKLALCGLQSNSISITHMGKKLIPGIPERLDQLLKKTYGWLLICEFTKPTLG